jgi:hypothetical protein
MAGHEDESNALTERSAGWKPGDLESKGGGVEER